MEQLRTVYRTSNYTFNEYKEPRTLILTEEEHKKLIQQCVAVKLNGFIIKERGENAFKYTEIKRSKMNEYFGFNIKYQKFIEKKDYSGFVTVEEPLTKFIKSIEIQLAQFDGFKLMSSNPNYLNLYIPPTGTYLKGIPEKIIKFFESRVINPIALHEELASHAYRLRHPNSFIEKCFVHYSPNYGNCGKSLLAAILEKMYPNLANVGATQQQLTSRFNGWACDLLMLHVEELQNSNYRNHDFEGIIKQMTTKMGSGEKKGVDTKACEHHAIIGFNTNQKDLYGLIRADEATISRLVILFFKPKPEDLDWDEFKTEIGLNDKVNTEQDAFNLGYTMYKYLKEEYDISNKFSPCRYYEQEKFDLIDTLRKDNKNSIDSWLNELRYDDADESDEYIPNEYKLLVKKRIKGIEYTCIKNVKREINKSYSYFVKETNASTTFKIDSIIQSLKDKGFKEIASSGIRWLRIETIIYEKLVDSLDSLEEVEFD